MLDGELCVRAESTARNEQVAVDAIAAQITARIPPSQLAGVIFFCAAEYAPEDLARALTARFDCTVVGCTTAGEIGSQYQDGGIVALGLSATAFRLRASLINPIGGFDSRTSWSGA